MGIIKGQKINVRWGSRNKKWYEEKGYSYTKMYDYFVVDAQDLMHHDKSTIQIECENCKDIDTLNNNIYHMKLDREEKIYCKECDYKFRKTKTLDGFHSKYSTEEKVQIFRKVLNKELDKFPTGFHNSLTTVECAEVTKIFIDKLIEDGVLESIEEVPTKLRQKHFTEYGLWTLQDRVGLHKLLLLTYPGKWNEWEFHTVSNNYWQDEENCKEAIDWLFEQLINEGKVSEFNEMPRILTQRMFSKYGIGGMLKYYKKGIPELMMKLYPYSFKEWDFNVNKGYYQDDKNRRQVLEWFVEQLLHDRVIAELEDIPKVVTKDIFEKYDLGSFLANAFQQSPFRAFNFLYPDKWKQWEYRYSPNNLWQDPQNVRDAIIWVVEKCKEDGLINSVSDLQNKNMMNIFLLYNISGLFARYDIPFLISIIYGNDFNYMDNKIYSSIDGSRLDSQEELLVHDWLLSNFDSVNHIENKSNKANRWHNDKFNEDYVPDWIVQGNIIVEYFGLYYPDKVAELDTIRKYVDKTHRKIEFYSKQNNYFFVDIYPEDLKDLNVLSEKFTIFNMTS